LETDEQLPAPQEQYQNILIAAAAAVVGSTQSNAGNNVIYRSQVNSSSVTSPASQYQQW
jgi:hypothetical protein